MKLRKIRIEILAVQGIIYRCFIIFCNTLFFFFGIKGTHLLGDTTFWQAMKYALGVSLTWNVINTILYYTYHYIWARIFKLGKNGLLDNRS